MLEGLKGVEGGCEVLSGFFRRVQDEFENVLRGCVRDVGVLRGCIERLCERVY